MLFVSSLLSQEYVYTAQLSFANNHLLLEKGSVMVLPPDVSSSTFAGVETHSVQP